MRCLAALALLAPLSLTAGQAGDIARAIRENSFDRKECYRVRDLTIIKEDLRIYLTDGHLIFSKPVAGRRTAAVFTSDVEGGDAEIMLLPPDRAERRTLAAYIKTPNLDEHFHSAIFMFTDDDYDALISQFPKSPANQQAPDLAPRMDEQWTPILRSLGESYQTRLTLDLLDGAVGKPGLFAALVTGNTLGNFDVIYDPDNAEQLMAGQVASRNDRVYFDTWTSFRARSMRGAPVSPKPDLITSDYRIQATIAPDLSMTAVTRLKVKAAVDGTVAARFEIAPAMTISKALVDGKPAEVLQRDSLRSNLAFGGNGAFLVVPAEPMHAGREYEFEIHHSGQVIHDAGDRVFYVSARGNWYPIHGLQFTAFDLLFRYPRDLDLVAAGDVVEDRTEGDWHVTRRRTSAPVRMAGFNLGNYTHARVEQNGFTIDVCANRELELALRPSLPAPIISSPAVSSRRITSVPFSPPPPPSPTDRLQALATEVVSSMEFMASRLGPPALTHLTISPIPGTFGQGFPGLIYLSTLAYLKNVPHPNGPPPATQDLFIQEVMLAHEVAHQWWGNRVVSTTYRDTWLMEALANYTALMYLEKTKGVRSSELMLDYYRTMLLEKDTDGKTIESAGPIVLGGRLLNSMTPAGWQHITYGKGTWIMQMLRRRLGDRAFLAMLAEILKRYERSDITTEEFRVLAAQYLPPRSDDPKLESFFDQWVYSTGIPALKLTYALKGTAPNYKLTGTVAQSEVGENCSVLAPVEIRVSPGHSITQWVRTANEPATFSVSLKQPPLKVTLDPNHSVLRR
jgi:peptidase M1-like protein